MLKARAGINLVHIPYKGAAPATTATIAGEVPVEFACFANSIWLVLCAPRGGPESVLARLRFEVNRLAALPDVEEKFNRSGALESFITTPEEMNAMIRADNARYGKVVKGVDAKVD